MKLKKWNCEKYVNINKYDIEETKNRNDLIKKLRHYGLIRIQKSAFSGYLNHDKRLMIKKEIESNILSPKDSILQLEICENCKQNITQLGNSQIPSNEEKEYEVLI